jgi:hypothetical protein
MLENTIHEEIVENMITLRGVLAVNDKYEEDKKWRLCCKLTEGENKLNVAGTEEDSVGNYGGNEK